MANLVILGHVTRGKEVIEILEMLGGKNIYRYVADSDCFGFYIGGEKNISYDWFYNFDGEDETIFTLEEFLEKFPYKVGDKVDSDGIGIEITGMYWLDNTINYEGESIKLGGKFYCLSVQDLKPLQYINDLQPYKEETMEERKYSDLRLDMDQDDKLATEATIDGNKITPPKNHLIGKITKVDNGMLVEFVKKQTQYPKTYKECCDVLSLPLYYNLRYYTYEHGYNEYATSNNLLSLQDKLNTLGKLIICRNAYWKIAGEQMGLDKSWEPDWSDGYVKYVITFVENKIYTDTSYMFNYILTFPTKEIRDTFYEKFKDLIEQCKDLL